MPKHLAHIPGGAHHALGSWLPQEKQYVLYAGFHDPHETQYPGQIKTCLSLLGVRRPLRPIKTFTASDTDTGALSPSGLVVQHLLSAARGLLWSEVFLRDPPIVSLVAVP